MSAIRAVLAARIALTSGVGAGWIGRRLLGRPGTGGEPVRGFIPKTGRSDLPSDAELGRLIRERIRVAIS
jgi:hypothetical protein